MMIQMNNYLKKISGAVSLIVMYGFTCLTLQAARIRDYNYKTDYQPAHSICMQHWKAFDETDSLCAGAFDALLFTFSPSGFKMIEGVKPPKAKVLIDKEVIGIALYVGMGDMLPKLLEDTGMPKGNSYGELAYIAIDEKHQGKGFGSMLFNACKEDLLRDGNIKTILARITSSNIQAINWHKKQGFVAITETSASNAFEEAYRIESNAHGQLLFKLEVEPRQVSGDLSTYKKYLQQRAPEFINSEKHLIMNSFGQTKIAHFVADNTWESEGLVTYELRAHIARHYLIGMANKKTTLSAAPYILRKKKLDPQVKKAIEGIFRYIDTNMDALGTWLNQPEQIKSIEQEANKVIAMDTQTEALLLNDEQKAIH